MRWCLLLFIFAAGISAAIAQSYNNSISRAVENRRRIGRQNGNIKRYACPVGFFRLKRYCYYLSGGMAPWKDAHFHCKDRNATLAVLDRNGKDRMLRKYLMNDQFTKLERWIGGIFNWQQMAWEWGVSGEKVGFQNFGNPQSQQSKQQYAWHCITIDPTLKYKWSPRSCLERKHYICEVEAGRIARRRKKTTDPYAPQYQRLKPQKGKKYSNEQRKPSKQNKRRPQWRRNLAEQNENNYWAHGVKLGSRPPTNRQIDYKRNRKRHRPNRTQSNYPKVTQITPREQENSAFYGNKLNHGPQSLTDISKSFPQFSGNELASEEVLLKP